MPIKFKVTKEAIIDGLQRVQNVVSTRTTLPILSNVLVQASTGSLSLTTTDLDVGVRCKVEAEVSKAGSTTLPARKLFSILKEVPAAEIEVEVDDRNAASIRCGHDAADQRASQTTLFERDESIDRATARRRHFILQLRGMDAALQHELRTSQERLRREQRRRRAIDPEFYPCLGKRLRDEEHVRGP